MENAFIQLSKVLYQIKQENQRIQQNNLILETKIAENETNLILSMNACVELYEMLLIVVDQYNYGKDTVTKMASAMAKVYVNLVKRGLKTLEEVPERLRAEVEAELEGDE